MSRQKLVAILLTVGAAAAVSIPAAAGPAAEPAGKKAFVAAWEGRAVVLAQTLYSIVYDERSRWVPVMTWRDRVAGLTVGTPGDTYYQFDARRESESDIADRDPNRVVSLLRKQYFRAMHLDLGSVQDVEPLMLVRYEPGGAFLVEKVQIQRDRVRLFLHKHGEDDLATSVTVKWPVPLSKNLSEAAEINAVLARFVTRR